MSKLRSAQVLKLSLNLAQFCAKFCARNSNCVLNCTPALLVAGRRAPVEHLVVVEAVPVDVVGLAPVFVLLSKEG